MNHYSLNVFHFRHVDVNTGSGHFIFSVKSHPEIPRRNVGFSLPQRKWAVLSLNQDIDVKPYHFNNSECLSSMVLEADFMQKKSYSVRNSRLEYFLHFLF